MPPRHVRSESVVTGERDAIVLDPALQGDVVHHTFVIRNEGAEELQLSDVALCSNCILEHVSQTIAPGSRGALSIVIPTDPLGGQVLRGPIRVTTNQPARPTLTIDFTLEVREFAAISPYRVWLSGPLGSEITATTTVTPNAEYPFEITGLRARKGTWFTYAHEAVERDGRRAFAITLRNTRQKPGPYQDVLFVQTDHPLRPEFKLRVEGRIGEAP